jgi:drug/metabolite transporter (DMT)-like permease
MWVALGDRAVFGTRLGRQSVAGLLVGFVGILVLGGTGSGSAGLIWIVSVLLGSVGFAAGALASRALPLVEGRIVATGLQMLLGGLMVAAAGIIHGDLDTVHFHTLQSSSLLAWLYLLFVSALLGFTLYMWLLGSAPATLVATASYVDPVMALVFGWALLGEGLTARAAVAATIIVAGAALIVSSPTKHQPASEDEVGK